MYHILRSILNEPNCGCATSEINVPIAKDNCIVDRGIQVPVSRLHFGDELAYLRVDLRWQVYHSHNEFRSVASIAARQTAT